MREYLKYEHYIEIDKLADQDAEAKLRRELNAKQGEMNRQAGHFTEMIVAGVMNNYDNRIVDGETYFSQAGPVTLIRLEAIHRRAGTIKEGQIHEIDVLGEYTLYNGQPETALGAWLVSVRYRKEKMGEKRCKPLSNKRRLCRLKSSMVRLYAGTLAKLVSLTQQSRS